MWQTHVPPIRRQSASSVLQVRGQLTSGLTGAGLIKVRGGGAWTGSQQRNAAALVEFVVNALVFVTVFS